MKTLKRDVHSRLVQRMGSAASLVLALGLMACSADNDDWCGNRAIVEDKRAACHDDPVRNGAPMPLVAHEDILDHRQMMIFFVQGELMPPDSAEDLSESERYKLLDWLEDGAPETCE